MLIFEDENHVSRYAKLRRIPEPVMAQYVRLLSDGRRTEPSELRVLDIGAGTGLFSIAFISHPSIIDRVRVIAIDRSAEMCRWLNLESARLGLSNIEILNVPFEGFDSVVEFDVIICSEVIHLLSDIDAFVRRARHLLLPGGRLGIRTSSQWQLLQREWYDHFPRARVIDLERHRSLEYMEAVLRLAGFDSAAHVMDESREMDAGDYSELFRSRAFSTLHLLTDEEFASGLASIDQKCAEAAKIRYDYRMSLVVARRLD